MSLLPALINDDAQPARQLAKAAKAQRNAELALYKHGLEARCRAECDRIDSQALSDAIRTALREELGVLDWGLEQAKGSRTKSELVARKVQMLSTMNNSRISRRFR